MYKILIFCITFISSQVSNHVESSPSSFENAVKFYETGAINEALEAWKKLENSGLTSAELYKNIAACYYRQEDFPLAVLYYEKALKIEPGNKTILRDLEQTRSAIPGLRQKIPPFAVWSFWLVFTSILSENAWMWNSIFFALLCLVFVYHWLFKKIEIRTLYLRFLTVFMVLTFIMSTLSLYTRHLIRNDQSTFISTKENTSLKSGPDNQSPEIESIPVGESLRLLDKIGDWYEVVLPDGSSGWVRSDLLTPV